MDSGCLVNASKNATIESKRIAIDEGGVHVAAVNGGNILHIRIFRKLWSFHWAVKSREKSNEIKEIPKLLKKLDISNCVISIDAIVCQKPIVKEIVEQKGYYCLVVKTNQQIRQSKRETI